MPLVLMNSEWMNERYMTMITTRVIWKGNGRIHGFLTRAYYRCRKVGWKVPHDKVGIIPAYIPRTETR